MDFLWNRLTEWLKEMLVGGIMDNLTGLFDSVNEQVSEIAGTVGQTPQGWNGGVFSMIQNLSENVVVPIAGIILAIVVTMELIQMLIDHNNMHDFDTFMIYKWIFKTFVSVTIVTNTWNIVMAVFDVAQNVVNNAAGIIISDTSLDLSSVVTNMEARLMDMEIGSLFGLWFQSMLVGMISWGLTISIFGDCLWPYDRNLPCDFGGSRSNGCNDGQRMGRYGTELPPIPAGTGLSGVSHYRLRGNLCCAGAEHRSGR